MMIEIRLRKLNIIIGSQILPENAISLGLRYAVIEYRTLKYNISRPRGFLQLEDPVKVSQWTEWTELQLVDTGQVTLEDLKEPIERGLEKAVDKMTVSGQTGVKTASQTLKDLKLDAGVADSSIDAAEINLLRSKLKRQGDEIQKFVSLIDLIIANLEAGFPWDSVNMMLDKHR